LLISIRDAPVESQEDGLPFNNFPAIQRDEEIASRDMRMWVKKYLLLTL